MAHIPPNLLTVDEAAARRGVSSGTIWRRIRSGDLQPVRILSRTLVDVAEVDRLDLRGSASFPVPLAQVDQP